MKIDLTELLRRVGNEADINIEEKVSFPEDGLTLTQPVKVNVHLVNTGGSVWLSGTLETEAELECSRCLKKIKTPLSAKIEEEYSKHPLQAVVRKEIELGWKDNSLDLDETIRQNLLLALPISTVCEPACKGE